jgi:hypothetical protein
MCTIYPQKSSFIRMKKSTLKFKTLWRAFQLIVVVMLVSCSGPLPTASAVKGKYTGFYGGGEEVIDLKGDGTFTQRFSIDGKELVSNTGKWSIDGADVKLENFVEVFDAEFKKLRQPPKKFSIYRCMWTANPDQLVFDFESGYIALKRNK